MKAAFQRDTQKKKSPLMGMLAVLAAICGFLLLLIVFTAIVHFIAM